MPPCTTPQFFDLFCPPCQGPNLTSDQIAAVTTLIGKLENAIAQVMLGNNVRVVVDQNGERLEFSGASLPQMRAYLEAQRAKLPGYRPACYEYSPPMRFFF
jgi:hypothetical protein